MKKLFVPLFLLASSTAMSPLNTANAQHPVGYDFVALTLDIGKATPDNRPGKLFFISNDGDDKSAEVVKFSVEDKFEVYDTDICRKYGKKRGTLYREEGYTTTIDTLEHNTSGAIGLVYKDYQVIDKYYIIGKGAYTQGNYVTKDNQFVATAHYFELQDRIRYQISKELYEDLKRWMEDDVQYKETKSEGIGITF